MKHLFAIILIVALSYVTVRPIVQPGFFPMHDDTQVGRVVAMGRALREGQFPVRWVADLGYGFGYPIFNFYAPLPYYVGGFLYALGMSGLTATKIMFIIGVIAPAFTMYISSVAILGVWGALTASLFLLLAPYHAVQVYVRGSVGEYWVLIFLPLLLWATSLARVDKKTLSILVGAIALAGIILSHTLFGFVLTGFFAIFFGSYGVIAAFSHRFSREVVVRLATVFLLGLGLSAFFWLPAITEMHATNVAAQISETANYRDHFVCVGELWNSSWGFGGSAPGCVDGFSMKLGKLYILGGLIWFVYAWKLRKKHERELVWIAVGITAVSIFFALPVSKIIWDTIPQFSYLQYPWRFLMTAEFGLSLLAGSLVFLSVKKIGKIAIATTFIIGCIWTNGKLFTPQYVYMKTPADFESPQELRWRVSRISDEYLPPGIIRPTKASEVVSATISNTVGANVTSEVDTATYARFRIVSLAPTDITIQRAYFPGWHYRIDALEVVPTVIHGLPVIGVPKGVSTLEARFEDTLPRIIGDLLSVTSVVVCMFIYGYKKKTTIA